MRQPEFLCFFCANQEPGSPRHTETPDAKCSPGLFRRRCVLPPTDLVISEDLRCLVWVVQSNIKKQRKKQMKKDTGGLESFGFFNLPIFGASSHKWILQFWLKPPTRWDLGLHWLIPWRVRLLLWPLTHGSSWQLHHHGPGLLLICGIPLTHPVVNQSSWMTIT